MTLQSDNRMENMMLDINRTLLQGYGNNIVLSKLKETSLNEYDLELDYNKIFHIKDEKTNTLFVRNLKFNRIFGSKLKSNEKLQLPLDEINSAILSEYDQIKNSIIHRVLSRRELVLSLIKNTHISMAFMNKFYTLLNQLVINNIFYKHMIDELVSKNNNFDKYVNLILEEGFAELDSNKNLKATNKLKLLFKNKKEVKDTVDEALFILIKNHYDYIIYDLNIHTLKTHVNIVSCLIYLVEYMKLKDIKMKLRDFYRVYLTFYNKVDFDKFLERVNNLVYSNVISSDNGVISLAV
ncbi:MAG: hypothetical protein AABW92_05715 [Nanoarchaeota archaeon]